MTASVIKEVIASRDLSQFLRVPWKIYAEDAYWVPPLLSEQRRMLDRKKNPLFHHCEYNAWILMQDGVPAGRILAYIDFSYNTYYHSKTGFIGFFECPDHMPGAQALFQQAEAWLKENGMLQVIGPMNFSIGNECGVQLNGYATVPYLQMNHTPPYYVGLFEKSGYTKAHDLYAYKLVVEEAIHDKILPRLHRITAYIRQQKGLSFRRVNMKKYILELERINSVFNHALQDNWGFVPSTMEEVLFTADALKMIADPEMILFAEQDGAVIGCSISIPDVNQVLRHLNGKLLPWGWIHYLRYKNKIDRLRVYLLGILPEHRGKGRDAAFYYMSILKAYERGYKEAELSWISENNTSMIHIVEKIGATRYKTYRMYRKSLV